MHHGGIKTEYRSYGNRFCKEIPKSQPTIVFFTNKSKNFLKRLNLKKDDQVIIQLKAGTNSLFSMHEAYALAREIKKISSISIVYRLDAYLLDDFNKKFQLDLSMKEFNELVLRDDTKSKELIEKIFNLMQDKDGIDPNFHGVTEFLKASKDSALKVIPILQNTANSEIESQRAVKPPKESPMPAYTHLIEMAHSPSLANRSKIGMQTALDLSLEKKDSEKARTYVILRHDSPFAKLKASGIENTLEGVSGFISRIGARRARLASQHNRFREPQLKNTSNYKKEKFVNLLRNIKYKLS